MRFLCLQRVNDVQPDALVRAAGAGDNDAWARLVDRYDRLLRSVARSYRLQPSDVDDVVQTTWMRLYGHIDRVRDPAAIAGWLATTARREAMRVLQTHVREQLSNDPELGEDDDSDCPEARVLADEERLILERAIAVLPDRQRKLMNLLATQPDADYQHISATLEMPQGSIGPTRARGLERLRQDPLVRRHFGSA
jgi:RNA polymerase sigma factor (sigma-70 family)